MSRKGFDVFFEGFCEQLECTLFLGFSALHGPRGLNAIIEGNGGESGVIRP